MSRHGRHDDPDESRLEALRERRPTVTAADLVLVALPVALLVGWAAGMASGVSLSTALGTATLPALATLGYALFYAPPSTHAG